MPAGDIAAGLISGGLSLTGGIISDLMNKDIVEDQMNFQREAQKNAISWRVEDAKRAGIHPLYALGAQAPTSFPVAFDSRVGEGLRDMGQNLGTAVHRVLDRESREKHQLDLALGAKQMEESDARREMYLSEAARNWQQMNPPVPAVPGTGVQREGSVSVGPKMTIDGQDYTVPGTGAIDVKPVEQLSAKIQEQSVVAGEHPGYKEFMYRGMPMLMPETAGESAEEILSEMSMPAYIGLLSLNNKTYGGNWLKDFLQLRYGGKAPEEFYPTLNQQKKMGRMKRPRSEFETLVDKFTGRR